MKLEDKFCTAIGMEFCDLGELSKAIDNGEFIDSTNSKNPKMTEIMQSAKDIANALKYLHENDIIHGDIKPDNILRKSVNTETRGYICKVTVI